jgi:uncharacterized membrane protein
MTLPRIATTTCAALVVATSTTVPGGRTEVEAASTEAKEASGAEECTEEADSSGTNPPEATRIICRLCSLFHCKTPLNL